MPYFIVHYERSAPSHPGAAGSLDRVLYCSGQPYAHRGAAEVHARSLSTTKSWRVIEAADARAALAQGQAEVETALSAQQSR